MWRWLVLGGALAVVALAGCTAPSAVRIDRIDYAAQYEQNGPAGPSTIFWSGNPTFPLTVRLDPAPGCNDANSSCGPDQLTFAKSVDPLVYPTAGRCGGNTPSTVPPWRIKFYYQLVDARGVRSDRVLVQSTCYFTTAPLRYASTVLHNEPWLTGVLRPVTDVSWTLLDVSKSLVISLGLILLIAFPSQIFNSTLQEHYDEVVGWFSPLGSIGRLVPSGEARSPAWLVGAAFLLGGLLNSLLDPRWGFDRATLAALLGILLASAFTTTLYTLVNAGFLRRVTGLRGHLRVFGGGVAVAVGCVLVSRLTQAQPGYLYGVLIGYTLGASAPSLARHHQGRKVALASATVLVVSVAFWLLWTPVRAAAQASGAFPLVVLSTAMAGVFLGGMTSLLFNLLPLRWVDGEKLMAWRRLVWLALVVVAMFLFVHVVLDNAANTPHAGRNLLVTVVLFFGFAALSAAFWGYFRLRPEPPPAPAPALPLA